MDLIEIYMDCSICTYVHMYTLYCNSKTPTIIIFIYLLGWSDPILADIAQIIYHSFKKSEVV